MATLLYTTQEAAHRLTVSPRTLVEWRASGSNGLSYVKIGRKIRYTTEGIEAFIARNTTNLIGS
jgi:excisionase family DNA binding protein